MADNFLASTYKNTIRKLLPEVPVRYAGIRVVVGKHWGDDFINRLRGAPTASDQPDYEYGLVRALRSCVRQGDSVVVVGGGFGVTVAVAAQVTGPRGRIRCFEGGADQVRHVRDTAQRNGLADRIEVTHAFVARSDFVYSSTEGAALVSPLDLPQCDVLEMDCEGAELAILKSMVIRPREILVETHGVYGAPTAKVKAAMEAIGYEVEDHGLADPRSQQFCEENDICVLAGRLKAP
jgi:hypothetical protein